MDKSKAIQQFLEEFNGDPIEAVKALRDYVKFVNRTKRPRVATDAPV